MLCFKREERRRRSPRIGKSGLVEPESRYPERIYYPTAHKRALIPGELLIKRLIEEGIVRHEEKIMIQGFGDDEDILGIFSVVLTDKGKRLLDDWARVDESLSHEQL